MNPTKNIYNPETGLYTSGTAEITNQAMQQKGAVDLSKPIDANNLLTTTLKVPAMPQNNPYVGLGSGAETKSLVPPTYTPPQKTPEDTYVESMAGLGASPSASNILIEEEKRAGIEQKTQTANSLKSQIESNVAQAKAAQQALESQSGGKDVTSTFLGRQQQEIDRQLAIRNLPLTAQYQASLGDLQGAQASVEKLFTARLADAQSQYEYKKDLYKTAYEMASSKEKKLIEAKAIEDERRYQKERDELNFTREKELAGYKSLLAAKESVPTGKYSTSQDKQIDQINTGVSNNFSYKAVNAAKSFTDGVIASLSQGTGTGDIAAINQFQKVIDEGAVTRDQDVKLVQESQSFLNTLKTKISKLERGEQLSPELRSQMKTTVSALYQAKVNALNDDPYVKAQIIKAQQNGIDTTDTILGQLGAFTSLDSPKDDTNNLVLKNAGVNDEDNKIFEDVVGATPENPTNYNFWGSLKNFLTGK